jgi:formate dehydrogenase major subunit
MTNGWIDIKNADMMLVMGGNPAENHPCGFKWAIEAKRNRNAPLIVVDPRYTRTAAVSDLFVQIRAGSDIALLGAIINYTLQNDRVNHEYLVNYTNAAFIVKEGFQLPEEGLYSGYNAETRSYDNSSWNYEEGGNLSPTGGGGTPSKQHTAPSAGALNPAPHGLGEHGLAGAAAPPPAMPANIAHDTSLQHPRSVYQLLKRQYSRYTLELVERITGIPKEQILKVADLFTSIRKDGDLKKAGTIIYAVGWTQHSSGTQTIRAAALLQLLLGNIGRAGGGVNALRGHSNIQGATDMAGIFDLLPGYLKVPKPSDTNLNAYLSRTTTKPAKPGEWASFNYWSNTPRFAVSLLKSLYGDAATKENDFAFDYLPKVDRNYSWTEIWDGMYRGEVKGLFAFGMNGVMIGPNSSKNINALKKADWLVVCELYADETSEFWKSPGISAEEMKTINTTVYRLPGAGFAEKDGTMVNSARWLQWKWVAVPPPGDAKLDQEILARIFLKIRELYKAQGGKFPEPILNATWSYSNKQNPSLSEIAREINGKAIADVTDEATNTTIKAGQQLPGFGFLRDDGSTACGNWIYCGSWTEAGPMMQRRGTDDPSGLGVYPNWAWSWPANRRVLYNRASCDSGGKPWDASRAQVWWNEAGKKWAGNDVPDFKVDSAPLEHMGPFIMNPEGVGRLFVPLGMVADGPFPEHYETFESPVQNLLHPQQNNNPVAKEFKSSGDKYGTPAEGYNIVCTTYRLTEHYHYWTKNNPVNVELVPEPFVEIPAELADEMGIRGGEKVKVSSARSHYIAKAMVTRRIHSMMIDGKKTFQIGIPIHWGYRGIQEDKGRTALTLVNSLTPAAIDPNAYTPEFKGFLVKLEKV